MLQSHNIAHHVQRHILSSHQDIVQVVLHAVVASVVGVVVVVVVVHLPNVNVDICIAGKETFLIQNWGCKEKIYLSYDLEEAVSV